MLRQFRPWLRPRAQILIHFVCRNQGLFVARGNPLNIVSLSDVVKTKARFISRQRGSGTQIALELMLESSEIDKKRIYGFNDEEYTHAAIASAVASGAADVGLGIETAARKLEIGFVPLFIENYYLLMKRETIETRNLQDIVSVMKSKAFRKIAGKFSGYDVSQSGSILEIEDAIRSR